MNTGKVILFASAVLISTMTYARGELKKGREIHFFAHIAGDYQLNKGDVVNTNNQYAFMKSPGNMGIRGGYEFMYMGKHRIFLSVSMEYSYVGQRLNIGYLADEAGYPGSQYVYTDRMTFSNKFFDWKWRGGFSFKTGNNAALEISTGLDFNYPLNGAHKDSFVAANIQDAKFKEPVAYYVVGWGNTDMGNSPDGKAFVNLRSTTQIAMRFIEPAVFNDRSIKIGLDISYLLAGDLYNRAEATFYGKDRSVLNKATFSDKHMGIGLSVGVEL